MALMVFTERRDICSCKNKEERHNCRYRLIVTKASSIGFVFCAKKWGEIRDLAWRCCIATAVLQLCNRWEGGPGWPGWSLCWPQQSYQSSLTQEAPISFHINTTKVTSWPSLIFETERQLDWHIVWLLTAFPHQVRTPPSSLRPEWRWARPRLVTTSPTTSTWPASARSAPPWSRPWTRTGSSSPSTWSTGSTPWARRWTVLVSLYYLACSILFLTSFRYRKDLFSFSFRVEN